MVDISNIKIFAVIGAGSMGREIAEVALMGGFEKVILNDINQDVIEDAVNYINNGLKSLEAKGKLNQGVTTDLLMNRLIKEKDLKNGTNKEIFKFIPDKRILRVLFEGKIFSLRESS